jgi:hypothetical protein
LDLFNYSFANGVVPTTWRVAKVLPAYKNKGARSSPASYRPISITSTVARLFERMVHARLISFFLSHNHLSECQFGFRRGRNTRDCLFVATEIIKESLRADSSVFGAFIDIIRAFDSVPIYALLHKLTRLGVDGNMLRWLHEFLSHRSVTTSWPGTCLSSPAAPLHCGLPQGCVLSPLLFIVYINDLLMDLNTFCPRIVVLCFADDLALFTRGGLVSDQRAYLQQGLNILSTWCRRWLLLCSEDKSAVVLFSRNRALLSRPVAQFKLQDFLLSFAQSYRYLGVILDSSLTWSEHSSSVLRKVNSAVVRLHQVVAANRFFSPVQVIHLVKVLVVPIFTYSFPFWRPSVAEYNSLNSLILRPLRAAFSLISTVSQMALFHETDLLPARLLWESSCLALLHCLHRRSPSPAISSLFSRLLAAPPYSGPWQFRLASSVDLGRRLSSELHISLADITPSSIALMIRAKANTWVRSFAEANPTSQPAWLRSLKPYSASDFHPPYLHFDHRVIASFRMQLRLNCLRTNSWLHKLGLRDSPSCPAVSCAGVPETCDHLLLRCPSFSNERATLALALSRLGLPLCLSSILGAPSWGSRHPSFPSLLRATSSFLHSIARNRFDLPYLP